MWDPDTELQEHAERYAVGHDGRHPFTDAWPWAEAIVAWYRRRPRRLTTRSEVVLVEDDWALVVAGVAESLRLRMRTGEIGDIRMDLLSDELLLWARVGNEFPRPGEAGWPAPDGSYADRWDALADVLIAGGERGRSVVRAVTAVLKELAVLATSRPYLPQAHRAALMEYRFSAQGCDTVTLAEVAPALGVTPVPVQDVAWYTGFAGLEPVA
ncbi:hypothetical protein ABZW10_36650 [Kitasatospora sp. NPDC004723]|uniref:hypothetical protein n=1 Tax=Kitasatospora sp. NPDC004723 TaxID=3154288 RepID=UPI0033A693F8